MFHWQDTFEEVAHPDDHVKIINEVLLNVCSDFLPKEHNKIRSHQMPWITPSIKRFLRKKNRDFKSCIRKGQPDDVLEGIQNMLAQGDKLVEDAKLKYFTNIGRAVSDSSIGNKRYWTLVNKILNKAKILEIPPLLDGGLFVLDFAPNALIFNPYFISKCITLDSGNEVPSELPLRSSQRHKFIISTAKIINITLNLNPNKAHG